MECITRAKTLQLNLTGDIGWSRSEKLWRSTFFLRPCSKECNLFWCSAWRSSIDNENSDCENRAKRENGSKSGCFENRHGGSWVSHVPIDDKIEKAGTWLQRPRVISVMNAALFVGQSADRQWWVPGPLLWQCSKSKKSRIKAKFSKNR